MHGPLFEQVERCWHFCEPQSRSRIPIAGRGQCQRVFGATTIAGIPSVGAAAGVNVDANPAEPNAVGQFSESKYPGAFREPGAGVVRPQAGSWRIWSVNAGRKPHTQKMVQCSFAKTAVYVRR